MRTCWDPQSHGIEVVLIRAIVAPLLRGGLCQQLTSPYQYDDSEQTAKAPTQSLDIQVKSRNFLQLLVVRSLKKIPSGTGGRGRVPENLVYGAIWNNIKVLRTMIFMLTVFFPHANLQFFSGRIAKHGPSSVCADRIRSMLACLSRWQLFYYFNRKDLVRYALSWNKATILLGYAAFFYFYFYIRNCYSSSQPTYHADVQSISIFSGAPFLHSQPPSLLTVPSNEVGLFSFYKFFSITSCSTSSPPSHPPSRRRSKPLASPLKTLTRCRQ